MTKIEIHEFFTMPDLATEGWNPNACGADYETPRAAALYEALGVSKNDNEYALAQHTDGRWALFGLTVSGHRYAVETARSVGTLSAERGWGYIPNCAPGTGTPIATFVRLEQGEWIIPIDKDHHPEVPRDVAIYDDEMGARLEARRTWRG